MITRSGGNLFSGAFRSNLTNPAWSAETPFEKSVGTTRASKLSPTYEAIARRPGGPRSLWFFGGARIERTTTQGTFRRPGSPTPAGTTTRRYEGKLTGTIASGHTLQGTFIDNRTGHGAAGVSAAASIPRR